MSRAARAAEKIVPWLCDHAKALLVVAAVLAVLTVARTASMYFHLESGLDTLLPPDAPSVVAIAELKQRSGGTSYVGVVVDTGGPANVPAAGRFLDELAERVRATPPAIADILWVATNFTKERAFFETHAAAYIAPADLERLRDAIEARRDYEVSKATGTLLEDEGPPALHLDDLRKKYRERFGSTLDQGSAQHLVSADGHTAVMIIAVRTDESTTASGGRLLAHLRADIAALGGPEHYADAMTVGFAGDIAARYEELKGLQSDLAISSILVAALESLLLVWFYRWWRSLLVLGVPLLLGVCTAFTIASLPPIGIHSLNSNTAFLGSIIAGNGVNVGVILLARYVEERRGGSDQRRAIITATATTARATATASAAAALAYGSLLVTSTRGFNQFGWIGGIGMILCWFTTLIFAPALLMLLDKDGSAARVRATASRSEPVGLGGLVRFIRRFTTPILGGALALSAVCVVIVAYADSSWIESNYAKLRRRDTWTQGERYWGGKMDAALGRSLNPIVIMTDGIEETRRVRAAVDLAMHDGLSDVMANVVDVDDLIPTTQRQSIAIALQIKEIITPRMRQELSPEDQRRLDAMLSPEGLRPLVPSELPLPIVGAMRESSGRLDRTVLVFPTPSPKTWHGPTIDRITTTLRAAADIAAEPGEAPPKVTGALVLSYDLTHAIIHDGTISTVVSFSLVLALVIFAFGLSRDTVLVAGSVIVGVLWLGGMLHVFGIKLNFANFIAFPITFGIGADYAVNVMGRYRTDGRRDVLDAIRHTGGAVLIASATTVIGYGSLLIAKNQALFLFGVLAELGEICCVAITIVVLPSVLLTLKRRRAAVPQDERAR